MRLHAKRRATHLAWAGAVGIGLGIALSAPDLVAYGSALLGGVAISRALTLVSVARARAAGFEMLWSTPDRTQRARRLATLTLRAELRNRDALPTRFRQLSAMHSPQLEVTVVPEEGEIPARGRMSVTLTIRPLRVGYHGIHGLTLETVRAPGLFAVPLSFTNPYVIEVLPRRVSWKASGSSGRRGRHQAPEGGGGRLRGDGPEFRELREHRPGDPFRRIAWKASARRGRLLVVEKELEQRDIVWILIDASIDSFSGSPGWSGIDRAIDTATQAAESHLARGDVVGLKIVGARNVTSVPLGRSPTHAARLISALSFECHTVHADRSDWDERDVLRRALEHARGLDEQAADLKGDERSAVASLIRRLLKQAPVQPNPPYAPSDFERLLRTYLLAFGVHPPVRSTSDRHAVERRLAGLISEVLSNRPRPTVVYVLGKPPTFETPKELLTAYSACRRNHTQLRFVPHEESLTAEAESLTPQQQMAVDALSARLELASEQGYRTLAKLGAVVITSNKKRYRSPRSRSARSITI